MQLPGLGEYLPGPSLWPLSVGSRSREGAGMLCVSAFSLPSLSIRRDNSPGDSQTGVQDLYDRPNGPSLILQRRTVASEDLARKGPSLILQRGSVAWSAKTLHYTATYTTLLSRISDLTRKSPSYMLGRKCQKSARLSREAPSYMPGRIAILLYPIENITGDLFRRAKALH